MKEITNKENKMLYEYTKDLLELMQEEEIDIISDSANSYALEEVYILSQKLKAKEPY